jgi:hypothetical protein
MEQQFRPPTREQLHVKMTDDINLSTELFLISTQKSNLVHKLSDNAVCIKKSKQKNKKYVYIHISEWQMREYIMHIIINKSEYEIS